MSVMTTGAGSMGVGVPSQAQEGSDDQHVQVVKAPTMGGGTGARSARHAEEQKSGAGGTEIVEQDEKRDLNLDRW